MWGYGRAWRGGGAASPHLPGRASPARPPRVTGLLACLLAGNNEELFFVLQGSRHAEKKKGTCLLKGID